MTIKSYPFGIEWSEMAKSNSRRITMEEKEQLFVTVPDKEYQELLEFKRRHEEFKDLAGIAVGLPKYYTERVQRGAIIQFIYKNWKGEVAQRRVLVEALAYGNTEYHPENQFLLEGLDLDKLEYRVFAVRDIVDLEIKAYTSIS
jgi:hypothetical protein